MAKRRITKLKYSIPAGAEQTFAVNGNYARVLEGNLEFEIAFDEDPLSPIEKGMGVSVEEFAQIRIKNTSLSTVLNVEIIVAMGQVDDDRLLITAPVVTRSGDNIDNGTVTIASTQTLIASVNTDRTRLMIKNIGAKTIYLGKTGVLDSTGFPLDAGDIIGLETGAELYAKTISGTSEVRIFEEIK